MSKLFLLTIAVALLIVAAAGIFAVVLYRRETQRAQFGKAPATLDKLQRRRRLMT